MFRLLAFLCAGIYAAMLVLGQDHGQLRFGLMQAKAEKAAQMIATTRTTPEPAEAPAVVATLAAGYADGLRRGMSNMAILWDGDTPCPLIGRVSMDLITADVTDLAEVPSHLDILCDRQGVDDLAAIAGTIGYEILTSLGPRYLRRYTGGGQ